MSASWNTEDDKDMESIADDIAKGDKHVSIKNIETIISKEKFKKS
jgi:hypothetical protein